MTELYLDIETTGLSWQDAEITVIGIYIVNGTESRLAQLVGKQATRENLLEATSGAREIYTYNGKRFDLPFIHNALGINLEDTIPHTDLMFECWRRNLYGGFKAVEQRLGIPRRLQGINGMDAVLLWRRYSDYGDSRALQTLLEYNKEDVINLKALRDKLHRAEKEGN